MNAPTASSSCGRPRPPSRPSPEPGGRPITRSPNTSTTSCRCAAPEPPPTPAPRAHCALSPRPRAPKRSKHRRSVCCRPCSRARAHGARPEPAPAGPGWGPPFSSGALGYRSSAPPHASPSPSRPLYAPLRCARSAHSMSRGLAAACASRRQAATGRRGSLLRRPCFLRRHVAGGCFPAHRVPCSISAPGPRRARWRSRRAVSPQRRVGRPQ